MDVNPNAHIPALVDHSPISEQQTPVKVFESNNILLYLAEKYGKFLGGKPGSAMRAECLSWLFWQSGFLGPVLYDIMNIFR